MKKLLFSCLFIASHLFSSGQTNTQHSAVSGQAAALPGTFQLIYHPCKFKYLFSEKTLVEIEKHRQDDTDTKISLNECVEVFIPSRKKVLSPGFIPLPETTAVSE